ncbi:Enhancer of polycomb-like protein [Pleurostoma richardsiae]|uniref:Enhancer of polycomb-like protein n=1 Tax=Pleurostoma richardsiae TaxID=41990 RepID=A0AA38RUK9_9PEZI|nr:Enhancer of polycomb-like protein [Pleurostoma richardsiae]
MATRKVRFKKLNIKTLLPVLREDQINASEYESLTNETQIATGVEQAEENEYHLQAVLHGQVGSTDKEIPVPPPQESDINYDELYPATFSQPVSYIRFSQTVEECIGCMYDMTEEDDAFLNSYNQKRPAGSQLSEDEFEMIMEVFEDTASIQAPFASVDKTVLAYDMMIPGLNQLDTAKVMPHAKEIYEYWRSRRQAVGGSLHPSLKFETHQETDDMDPFVCFRRREVRQTRKTRARDVQSADKLKRLRRELEDGRQLIILSHERELLKRDLLTTDRLVFEQRAKLKEAKIRLGIKTDDEDLINQKPQKRKAPELPAAPRPSGAQGRAQMRPDGRVVDHDLTLLADKLAEKENELRHDIEMKIQNHRNWNKNHVDLTRDPLPPVKDRSAEMAFRPAKTQYLMTPPASASSASMDEPTAMELDKEQALPVFPFRGIAQEDMSPANPPAFRRRIGRLNRLWIDRRNVPRPASPPAETDATYSDRWKYDQDDSDDEQPVYEVDPYDLPALKFRATIPLSTMQTYQYRTPRPPVENGVHVGGPGGRPALPPAQRPAQPQPQSTS